MAPHSPDQKPVKKFNDDLLEKLKQDEEKERKRLEKEAKRREELNKITKESYERQAALLGKEKPKQSQPKKATVKPKVTSKSKQLNNKKQQNQVSENIFNQKKSYAPSSTVPKTKSSGIKEQFYNYGRTYSESNFHENAWKKSDSRSISSRSRHSSVSDSVWGDSDEHFPALGIVAPVPKANVWDERKSKQEAIKAMEPRNEDDEDAMLQQALKMSLIEAAQEEEWRKKMEEEYMTELQTPQISSKVCEDTDELDEFVRRQVEPSYLDNFQENDQHQMDTTVPENTASSSNHKGKTYSSGGARPKINKVIDRFGGWGLKDENKGRSSENLSNFVDEVVCDKASKKVDKQKPNYKSKYVTEHKSNVKDRWETTDAEDPWESTDTKENEYSKNSWDSSDIKDFKKPEVHKESWSNAEIFYDEKQTFVDDDDNWNSLESDKNDNTLVNVSPNKVLDSWLSSDDTHDKTLNEREELIASIPINYKSSASSKDNLSSEDLRDKKTSDSANVSSNNELKNSFKTNDSADLSQKIQEYHSSKSDLINDFSSLDESHKIPSLLSKDIWSDKSTDSSSFFSSFPDSQNLSSKSETAKFSNEVNCEDFNVAVSADADLPPILPPKTPPLAYEANITSGISDAESKSEPSILPPQLAPEVPVVPQFPMMSNPLFNPMLPGFNPMLGFGMNSLLARQMLLLSNPFLASQILAMEQQYRAMGIPVDFFSVPTSMPNVSIPGMAYPSMMQSTISANSSFDVPLPQNQPNNHQFTSVPENHISNPEEKSGQPSELKAFSSINSSNSVESGADNSWYKSYLSNDNSAAIPPPQAAVIPPPQVAVIPAPKSPTYSVNDNYLEHASEPSRLNQSASSFNNNEFVNSHVPNNLNSRLPVKKKENQRLPSAIEACMTKTEVTGWSDTEDDPSDARKFKTSSWDDGWGDSAVPAKPLRNAMLYDDKKRTVLRQPARQPQISRYPRK